MAKKKTSAKKSPTKTTSRQSTAAATKKKKTATGIRKTASVSKRIKKKFKSRPTTKKTVRRTPVKRKKRLATPTELPDDPAAAIDVIDVQLTQLLQKRASLVKNFVKSDDLPSARTFTQTQPNQFTKLRGRAPGPLSEGVIEFIFREVFSACRLQITQQRVAYLGPEYTYTHLAAIRCFGKSVRFVPVGGIRAVFEEVNRRHCDFGVVPIENSTDGRIADTLDMFTRLPVRICGQIETRISHSLLGRCPRDEIREVYSKPQALSQCRNWLARHLPSARLIEVTSTTTAAQLARDKPGAAAVASRQAAAHYELDILAEAIEDNPFNSTRFAIIGTAEVPATGNDRTAILFQIDHKPGALVDAMGVLKRGNLNMTWIESFPDPKAPRTYLFFVELEGHKTDKNVAQAIAQLERKTVRLKILGSFPAIDETI